MHRLAQMLGPARQAPLAFPRGLAAADQEHTAAMPDHHPDTHEGPAGIAAAVAARRIGGRRVAHDFPPARCLDNDLTRTGVPWQGSR